MPFFEIHKKRMKIVQPSAQDAAEGAGSDALSSGGDVPSDPSLNTSSGIDTSGGTPLVSGAAARSSGEAESSGGAPLASGAAARSSGGAESSGQSNSGGTASTKRKLPSRRTKPVDKKVVYARTLILLSMITSFSYAAADPTSRFLASGFVQMMLKDNNGAVESFSKAISIRNDPYFYRCRAAAYSHLQPPDSVKELADLEVAIRSNVRDPSTLRRAGGIAAKLGQHDTAVEMCRILADTNIPLNEHVRPCAAEAAHKLLYMDEVALAAQIVPAYKESDATKEHGFENVVQALIFRENGHSDLTRKIASERFSDYCNTFSVSDKYTFSDDRITPDIIETILLLDQSKMEDAAKKLAAIDGRIEMDAYPLVKLLHAWLCFDRGEFEKCLRLTDDIAADQVYKKLSRGNEYDRERTLVDSMEGSNLKAAAHLLREHAYRGLQDVAKAEAERKQYLATNSSGRVFIPFPYRKWLSEGAASEKISGK